jgi:hypothetical protein
MYRASAESSWATRRCWYVYSALARRPTLTATYINRGSFIVLQGWVLTKVQQWFGVMLQWRVRSFLTMFYDIARACSLLSMLDPRRVRTLFSERTRSMHVHVATRAHEASVAMLAGGRTHRGPEKPCVREKKCVEEMFA